MSDAIVIQPITVAEPLENMGGCRTFGLLLKEWVTEMHAPVHGVVVTEPSATRNPVECRVTEDTARWREEPIEGSANVRCTFTCNCPTDTIEQRQNIQAIARHGLVLEVPDNNNVLRRLGDWNNPARLTWEYDTAAAAAGRNEWTLTFTWVNDEPAPIIDYDYAPADYDEHLQGSGS